MVSTALLQFIQEGATKQKHKDSLDQITKTIRIRPLWAMNVYIKSHTSFSRVVETQTNTGPAGLNTTKRFQTFVIICLFFAEQVFKANKVTSLNQ